VQTNLSGSSELGGTSSPIEVARSGIHRMNRWIDRLGVARFAVRMTAPTPPDRPYQAILDRAVRIFTRYFDRAPTIAASAPGRVNLIGEHTDYNEGFVLPMAIDRRAVVVAAPSPRERSRLFAIDLERHAEVDLRQPLRPSSDEPWSGYVLGVARQITERQATLPNFDLALASTVPIGAGLASSAAVEVAAAMVLERLAGIELNPAERAELCRLAENRFVGTPCGIMDMFVATMARSGDAMLIDCASQIVTYVPFPALTQAALLVIDTGVAHEHATGAYADRRITCEAAARRLGVASLRDATRGQLDEAELTPTEHQRALHVITENERARQGAAALQSADLDGLGELMFQSHASLRYLYEASCPELDTIVNTARELKDEQLGVYGARLTGGGFGGCAIALCRPDALDAVAFRISQSFQDVHEREPEMFVVRCFAGGSMHEM
jgi:galactokinase